MTPQNSYWIKRRPTRQVQVGGLVIGGDAPISVQSMTNTPTQDIRATLEQIDRLHKAGCELVRVAVPDRQAALALREIVAMSPLPVVADIHFDYRLALLALEAGVAKLRLNPGNIGGEDRVRTVVREAAARQVPIRIGVNAGSLSPEILNEYGGPTPQAMVKSAQQQIELLESMGFTSIVISLKASDVMTTVAAYRQMAAACNYPLHLGVTEAGSMLTGSIRSAIGLGLLLAEGIGDTLRVSLTGDPIHEVRVGYEILKSLHLRERGPVVISCPTCGRCGIDLQSLAEQVERLVAEISEPLHIAVMGCTVNGPGEARLADLGIAGGKGEALIFRKGKIIRKVAETGLLNAFQEELQTLLDEIKAKQAENDVTNVSPAAGEEA
ncbi:MAG TPA: flavodoxin-dependent (E)-4-hydroxy-3-methylbut-2-enyl-diphosphate synthase [Bacillota bacterium]|jgi:(E)-4-hydroxy-3-methylbut-2-enyl-diphosphate synthase|nr:flavodoxin-dependent (E)-4-hydroxy-3-methylbut-2-enyl-diphosphate synthase [Bacillota bacterium]HPT67936.1 flavodoxin-dependent (E)-4-hydroxy-3-methylbut-2-enyl-diphosphate synthase [Bacillota bacterium]